ncbi:MAG TPA: VOC family protein [Rhizomicrobium sp.]|jgi:predicted 3-demethylubiquinone-9 3-methyltransferase (glyoxalase superfamily)
MQNLKGLRPCLWFNDQGEEAAKFYCAIFQNSKITRVSHYSDEGHDIHGHKAGDVLTVEFELDGRPFMALNGGSQFKFSEAVSFSIDARDQEEVDYYSSKLIAGGGEQGPCGWLKDKFGLSWQVSPVILQEMLNDADKKKSDRALKVMLQMHKLDVAKLQEAYNG